MSTPKEELTKKTLEAFKKKEPEIKIMDRGSKLRINIDMDEFSFDGEAVRSISEQLAKYRYSSASKDQTERFLVSTEIQISIRRLLVRLIKTGHITWKGGK